MPMPQMLRSPLAVAALVALTAFSTTACSTTTDSIPDDSAAANASSKAEDPAPAQSSPADSVHKPGNQEDGGDAQMNVGAQDFSMTPGDTTPLADGSQLRYLRMVNDSRCMPDVQCIWEGDAELSFQWQKNGGGQETFSLHSSGRIGEKDRMLGTQRLTLLSLARGAAPEARLRLEPGS